MYCCELQRMGRSYMDIFNYYGVSTLALCQEKCTTVEDDYGGTCIAVNYNADPAQTNPHCGIVVQGLQTSLSTVKTETGSSYNVVGKGAQKETLDATHVVQIMPRGKYVCAAYSEPRSTQAAACDFADLVFESIATPDCPVDVMKFNDEKIEEVSEYSDNPNYSVDLYYDSEWGIKSVDGCTEDVIRISLGLGKREGLCECDPENGICVMGSSSNCGVFEINKWSCPETTTTTTTEATDAPTTTTTTEATDAPTTIAEAVTDPCLCPEGTGWSRTKLGCFEDSTTACDECPTMNGCEAGSCAAGCYGYMPLRLCQCTPSCLEFGNCCQDAKPCMTCEEQCDPNLCPCTCPEVGTRDENTMAPEETLMEMEVVTNPVLQTITQTVQYPLALCGAFAALYYIYHFLSKRSSYSEVQAHEEI